MFTVREHKREGLVMQSTRRSFVKLLSSGVFLPATTTVGFLRVPNAFAAEQKVLSIAQGNDILSLDPADHGNNSTESALVNIYDYLVTKDFSGETLVFTPNLAKSWSTSDQVRWVLNLRDDVRWHDGSKFTANDVKFTVERTQGDPKLKSANKFSSVKAVKVIDDYTLQIETKYPNPLLLHSFVGNGAGLLPKLAFEAAGDKDVFFRNPVGTGPYRFKEWRKADRLFLEKNADWWGGQPKWDSVVVRAIPETATRVSEFITGGVDIAVNIPPEDIERIKANKGTRVISFDIARNLALHVRTGEKWVTHDPRVREAIDLAIDRNTIAQQVVNGYGSPTRGFFPKKIPGSNPELSANLPYDPEKARTLLREAGKEGAAIKLSTPSGRYVKDREISETVVGYLEDAGFRPQLEVLDWTIYNSRLTADGFGELYLWGMGSYTDGSSLFQDDFKRHYDWTNAEFNSLREKARNPGSEDARLAILRRAQEIVADQRVRIGLIYPQSIYGVNDRIKFDGRFDEMIFAEDVVPV
ncbi:ABC transporter substrate-binding protein [Agrobacterium rhizogenes]|nr:ABC transporter substrate-binding protein [Rhizobium rhizogenes]NTI52969.1 ABC transporter substrate-binding protein [Rhizobium rhizogenes]NTI98342.1 ABC transporter substrate-binding protein [Rhizobium rhizogenes]NTJ60771.1 ABC transporter substrate-binding protein [Rhizobium rhizogenes]